MRYLAFVAGYVVLTWISFVYPMKGFTITPWNPQAALAVALLVGEPAAWPVVWVALALGDGLVGSERLNLAALAVASGALTAGYAVIAAGLRRWVATELQPIGRRSAVAFLVVAATGALIASGLRAGALWAVSVIPFTRLPAVVYRASIGDGVGLIVTLPVLLVLVSDRYRTATRAMVRCAEWWAIAALGALGVIGLFEQQPGEQFKLFYVLSVPVVWASIRFGAVGAVWSAALIQALLIVAVQTGDYQPLTVFELQALMATLSATGLLLGAIVDERVAAEEALRASLRLAAAGDMAAALAHELNQPLTAISTYARASRVLAQRVAAGQASADTMAEVTDKLSAEAARAGDVVNRLRRFFREGSTDLQATDMADLLLQAVQAQAQRARDLGVRLQQQAAPDLPRVWVDRVQLAVVLRNLLANAIEAACDPASTADERSVQLQAERDGTELVVSVLDSGPGIARENVHAVFESRASGKPGGMGIGLAISHAILDAHGGRLWAEPGPGGRFRFALPIESGGIHDI